MRALTSADQAFLWMENRQQPMHVGGLQLFNIPEDAGPMFITDLMESPICPVSALRPFCRSPSK